MRNASRLPLLLAPLLAAACAEDQTVEIPMSPVATQLGWEVVPLTEVAQEPDGGDYRICIEDRLEISVYDDEDLRRKMPVRPDGKISFPLIGEVTAAGRTPEEVRTELRTRLSRYVRDPDVTIIVEEFAGTRVLILGEVGRPGIVPVRRNARVMDALAAAGGVNVSQPSSGGGGGGEQGADFERAYLIRNDRILGVDFRRLIELGDTTQNILVHEGDLIYIPSTLDNEVYVLGVVQSPGTIRFRNRISLVEALSEVGGPKENVTTGTVVVIRDSLTDAKAYSLSLGDILDARARNIPLQRGDIVYVTPSILDSLVDISNKILPLLQTVISGRQTKSAIQTWSENDRK